MSLQDVFKSNETGIENKETTAEFLIFQNNAFPGISEQDREKPLENLSSLKAA